MEIDQQAATRKEKVAAYHKVWAAANKAAIDAKRKAWNEANPERCAAHKREWAEKNKVSERARKAAYNAVRPAQVLARTRKRQAAKLKRTPPWANLAEIESIYCKAAELRGQGYDVQVDHVFPLQGARVSGLHVAGNLRVIPRIDNLKKSNTFKDN